MGAYMIQKSSGSEQLFATVPMGSLFLQKVPLKAPVPSGAWVRIPLSSETFATILGSPRVADKDRHTRRVREDAQAEQIRDGVVAAERLLLRPAPVYRIFQFTISSLSPSLSLDSLSLSLSLDFLRVSLSEARVALVHCDVG